MIREILVVDNPILRQRAKRVKKVDPSISKLIDDMLETMREAPGVGLAAPQVGVSLRVIVAEAPIELDGEETHKVDQMILINPEIIEESGEEYGQEGCLSIPGYVGIIKRSTNVTIKGMNRKGKEIKVRRSGFPARILQHEIDHINGVLFTDRIEKPEHLLKVTEKGQHVPAFNDNERVMG